MTYHNDTFKDGYRKPFNICIKSTYIYVYIRTLISHTPFQYPIQIQSEVIDDGLVPGFTKNET